MTAGLPVKTRFCPSPTGYLHLGNIRAALLSVLWALKNKGVFLLRIEDTDQERSKSELADALMRDLHWLGLDWHEGPECGGSKGPYAQSERSQIYQHQLDQLITSGQAYPCFCTEEELAAMKIKQKASGKPPRYAGVCRDLTDVQIAEKSQGNTSYVWRFKVPRQQKITFTDLIRGPQAFQSQDIGDFVICRSDGTAPFFFSNAVDDALMEVTCALRGEDHLPNTPRQLLICQALGLTAPEYGHIPLMVGHDGAPLSKRNGSASLQDLRSQGFLPLAIVNYLARLGHSYPTDRLLSLEELAAGLELSQLSRSAVRFDFKQLLYWQKKALEVLVETGDLASWIGELIWPEETRSEFLSAVLSNCLFPEEIHAWAHALSADQLNYGSEENQVLRQVGPDYFSSALASIEEFGLEAKPLIDRLMKETGLTGKALYHPLRLALTGKADGPELNKIMTLLTKARVLERLNQVLTQLGASRAGHL